MKAITIEKSEGEETETARQAVQGKERVSCTVLLTWQLIKSVELNWNKSGMGRTRPLQK